jgi:thiamine transport system ATP-binding protein
MLHVEDLRFIHPGQPLEYGFSFTARAGEVTAISGTSGSGKSTLLDLIAGFLEPRSGQIKLDGADLVSISPERRPISLLLQSESLFEHLSAGRNIALGLPSRTAKEIIRQKVDQALGEVGLSGVEHQIAATLSGGQKQRVALARTLLRNRPVLLLDEPFSALDDETRRTIRDLVGVLTRSHGWHTILVSHHADDVEQLAQRRYRLDEGRLELY